MSDEASTRYELIRFLENALAITDELKDGATGYFIEKALGAARSRQEGQGPSEQGPLSE